jgi:nucleotide-binding universal stress UspA family protein
VGRDGELAAPDGSFNGALRGEACSRLASFGLLDMSEMNSILVAYDDPTTETLGRAADLAAAFGSTLIVTYVAAPVESTAPQDAEQVARERLSQAESYLRQRGLAAELVPAVGPPAETILRLARERGADLIVVGTRKKGFLDRLIEGSVSQDVVRHAPCDVLVVA